MENQDLATWCREAHRLAVGKGFKEKGDLYVARSIALMHSELSELLEAHRLNPHAPCDKDIPLSCEEEEIADIFLRLCHYCGARGINLGRAASLKHSFNKGRPPMHGKKF